MSVVRFLVLLTIFVFGCNLNCAQTSKKSNKNYTEKIKNIYKEVKVYDYNPTYRLMINTVSCTYEIYVNGVLANYSFSTGRTAGEQSIDIPQYILKSGRQNIRIKIYPNAPSKHGVLDTFINKNAEFSLRIVYGEYFKEKNDSWKEVFSYKFPPEGKDNLPYYEHNAVFEAKVPYQLKGWVDGVDLSKEEPEKLEKEVWAKMEEIKKMYENKDIETIAKLQYNYLLEYYQSMYFNNPQKSSEWITDMEEVFAKNYSYALDEKTSKLFIMGNGKLVTLLQQGNDAYRDDSAFLGISKESYNFYKFQFYRPRPGAPLEVIR